MKPKNLNDQQKELEDRIEKNIKEEEWEHLNFNRGRMHELLIQKSLIQDKIDENCKGCKYPFQSDGCLEQPCDNYSPNCELNSLLGDDTE